MIPATIYIVKFEPSLINFFGKIKTHNTYKTQLLLHKAMLFLLVFFSLLGCKKKEEKPTLNRSKNIDSNVKYTEGFKIKCFNNHNILEIKKPWQNADKTYRYLLYSGVLPTNKASDSFDAIIKTPIEKIVVTSTTHIPALELLNVEESLIGFPETNYISSKIIRKRIDDGLVSDLGKNEGISPEVLLELNPNIVIGFGIDGTNKTLENINKAGIPVVYNGDWMETSPLAKAEWIKFFGVLFNKEKMAASIFKQIEENYLEAKELAKKAKTKPTVLSGAMHKDIWYLPKGNSTEAQFLEDANVDYLWNNTKGSGSLALSFESVFELAKNADLWFNPSNFASYESLKKSNLHYTEFSAFTNKNIYTITNTKGETGGVLYYELGTTRPDLVLKDIIKISHPDLLKDYQPYFFKPLQ